MSDSTSRFSGLAQIYAAARPDYPNDAVNYIIDTASLTPGDTIADIGAGTGISSRLFARKGFDVIAVEPNEDMRLQGEQSGTIYGGAAIKYVLGTGEATNLPGNSLDLVLAAQAFHWFRPEQALEEFFRILKPGAWTALIWNERDERDPLTAEYGRALRLNVETEKIEMKRLGAGQPLLESKLFCAAHKRCYANSQELNLDGLIQRAFSASYAPKEEPMAGQIRAILSRAFSDYAQNGKVLMRYETSVYMAQKPR